MRLLSVPPKVPSLSNGYLSLLRKKKENETFFKPISSQKSAFLVKKVRHFEKLVVHFFEKVGNFGGASLQK